MLVALVAAQGTAKIASILHLLRPALVEITPLCTHADVEEALLLPPVDDSGVATVISLASPATESVDSCSANGRGGRFGTPPGFVLPTLRVPHCLLCLAPLKAPCVILTKGSLFGRQCFLQPSKLCSLKVCLLLAASEALDSVFVVGSI